MLILVLRASAFSYAHIGCESLSMEKEQDTILIMLITSGTLHFMTKGHYLEPKVE